MLCTDTGPQEITETVAENVREGPSGGVEVSPPESSSPLCDFCCPDSGQEESLLESPTCM
jgi:hypothetical protein